MERVRRERELEPERQAAAPAPAAVPEQILRLQQGAGNAAVTRMLAREPQEAVPLDAPAATFSADQLGELLAHLQDQLDQAQRESAASALADRADQAAATAEIPEPRQKSGVLGTLAKPVRRLGSALKKAGAWLGIGGKRKPAAAAAPEPTQLEAERAQLEAMIGKLDAQLEAEKQTLGEQLGSMNDALDTVTAAIEPDEREAIVRQQSA